MNYEIICSTVLPQKATSYTAKHLTLETTQIYPSATTSTGLTLMFTGYGRLVPDHSGRQVLFNLYAACRIGLAM